MAEAQMVCIAVYCVVFYNREVALPYPWPKLRWYVL